MSTHVTIVKKPSGHNLKVIVMNPGDAEARVHLLADNQAVEVMVYGGDAAIGGGTIQLHEVDKQTA